MTNTAIDVKQPEHIHYILNAYDAETNDKFYWTQLTSWKNWFTDRLFQWYLINKKEILWTTLCNVEIRGSEVHGELLS